MGMSKDELKKMIDSTIFQNGNGQITGNGLNLVLNAIAENAGGGSGLQTLFFTMDNGGSLDASFENLDSSVQESMLEHNKQIFNSITTTYINFFDSAEWVNTDWGNLYGNFNFDNLLEFTKNMQFNCCLWDYYNYDMPFSRICSLDWIEEQGMEASAVIEPEEGSNNVLENFVVILYDRYNGNDYRLYPDGHLEYSSGGPT